MTEDRDFKRLVRARMTQTGESYTEARWHFDAPRKARANEIDGLPTTVAAFKKKVYTRARTKDLAAHLEERYGVRVTGTAKLDIGVYRVDRRGEPSWVARVFPSVRSVEAARGDAEILAYLAEYDLPAERLAHDEPVSMLAGQPVLVTEQVPGTNRRADDSEATMHTLGSTLGALHALPDHPGACARDAGSWHHLSVNGGTRRNDVDILLRLLDDAETRLDAAQHGMLDDVRGELEVLEDLDDLPKALIHPDPCTANLVAVDSVGILVDWTGAGRGTRLASFATMVGSVTTLALVDAAVGGYRQHATLEQIELDRLEAALIAFPFVLDVWTVLFQRQPLRMLMQRLEVHRQRAAAVARRSREAFAAPLERPAQPTGDQARLF